MRLDDGQRLLAFNDFFLGARSHISALYQITCGQESEIQSSSGVLVSTGAGSTGWVSSVFNMAAGVSRFCGGPPLTPVRMPWEDRRLLFVVREPFVSRHSQAGIVAGILQHWRRAYDRIPDAFVRCNLQRRHGSGLSAVQLGSHRSCARRGTECPACRILRIVDASYR